MRYALDLVLMAVAMEKVTAVARRRLDAIRKFIWICGVVVVVTT